MSDAGGNVFINTNVLLYAVDTRSPEKRASAREWLNLAWQKNSGRLSWQVLNEFYVNAARKMRCSPAEVRDLVDVYAEWEPIETSHGLIRTAWHLMDTAQISYWDALIVAAAERTGSTLLLTEDLQDGQYLGSVRVVNPFRHPPAEFLSLPPR